MKESMSATEDVTVPSSDVAEVASSEDKKLDAATVEGQESPSKKKGAAVRKPIRPKVIRPAAAKTDAFEVEFTFDPNEDPFKPKVKLGASPPRDQSGSQFDANKTVEMVSKKNRFNLFFFSTIKNIFFFFLGRWKRFRKRRRQHNGG